MDIFSMTRVKGNKTYSFLDLVVDTTWVTLLLAILSDCFSKECLLGLPAKMEV